VNIVHFRILVKHVLEKEFQQRSLIKIV